MHATFLNTPPGVICLVVLGVVSLINIYAHWIEDGLVGRLLYMALALTCAVGLLRYTIASDPEHLTPTIVVIFCLLGIRSLAVKSMRYFKYRRKYAKHLR
ncbi:hypothetical protein ACFL9L_004351 [Salmonella enterica]